VKDAIAASEAPISFDIVPWQTLPLDAKSKLAFVRSVVPDVVSVFHCLVLVDVSTFVFFVAKHNEAEQYEQEYDDEYKFHCIRFCLTAKKYHAFHITVACIFFCHLCTLHGLKRCFKSIHVA
jgi:hypothetical protein